MSAGDRAPALRRLQRPRLWLAIGLAALLAVVAVSLSPASSLPAPAMLGFDKFAHLVTYAALSAYAVMLLSRMRAQALAGLALVLIGIMLEVGQGWLTETRAADRADALANALGVLLGLLVSATRAARWLQKLDARLGPGSPTR
ncbi:VanZ family protein [Lysobacter sp. D1-1-M9]|uniref:VanZ family protein n=1 Tax=Novilysobacter longmucuonensis TaxID=3098603 RepID=UPI002FC585E7